MLVVEVEHVLCTALWQGDFEELVPGKRLVMRWRFNNWEDDCYSKVCVCAACACVLVLEPLAAALVPLCIWQHSSHLQNQITVLQWTLHCSKTAQCVYLCQRA